MAEGMSGKWKKLAAGVGLVSALGGAYETGKSVGHDEEREGAKVLKVSKEDLASKKDAGVAMDGFVIKTEENKPKTIEKAAESTQTPSAERVEPAEIKQMRDEMRTKLDSMKIAKDKALEGLKAKHEKTIAELQAKKKELGNAYYTKKVEADDEYYPAKAEIESKYYSEKSAVQNKFYDNPAVSKYFEDERKHAEEEVNAKLNEKGAAELKRVKNEFLEKWSKIDRDSLQEWQDVDAAATNAWREGSAEKDYTVGQQKKDIAFKIEREKKDAIIQKERSAKDALNKEEIKATQAIFDNPEFKR